MNLGMNLENKVMHKKRKFGYESLLDLNRVKEFFEKVLGLN